VVSNAFEGQKQIGITYSRCDVRRADIADVLDSPLCTARGGLLADDTHGRVSWRLCATVDRLPDDDPMRVQRTKKHQQHREQLLAKLWRLLAAMTYRCLAGVVPSFVVRPSPLSEIRICDTGDLLSPQTWLRG
jgi:hypothetical protein